MSDVKTMCGSPETFTPHAANVCTDTSVEKQNSRREAGGGRGGGEEIYSATRDKERVGLQELGQSMQREQAATNETHPDSLPPRLLLAWCSLPRNETGPLTHETSGNRGGRRK